MILTNERLPMCDKGTDMRILHLEDERPLREIIKAAINALEPESELVEFSNSDNALAFIEQQGQTVDLFILDIRIPGNLDGMGVARKIRDLGYKGVIVVTSAYTKPNPSLLTELNCRWNPKPWHVMEIHETIRLIKRASNPLN
jgi:DNA-binding response OmpR family regulator